MNEVGFRKWLEESGTKKKVASDVISRLKRVEREFEQIDLDEEYDSDHCDRILSAFSNCGRNEVMESYPYATFPIGQYHLNTYKVAVRKYIEYRKNE